MHSPDSIEDGFRERVEAVVAQIPPGRVMTYGQLAALCGNPRAARIVGGVAHFGDPNLPWHRVVNKKGGLAAGYMGGKRGHKAALEAEGFSVTDNYTVDVDQLIWWPEASSRESFKDTSEGSDSDETSQPSSSQPGLF